MYLKGYNNIKKEVVNNMSVLQEQAVSMIGDLSDDNVSFLIEIIRRLMPHGKEETVNVSDSEGKDAFEKMLAARDNIQHYFPIDFDPDKELEEARAERYGGTN